MALNWTMVDQDGRKPVPLPREKIFYSVEHCHISLQLGGFTSGKKLESKGTVFCTNQRVVFLEQPYAGESAASRPDTSILPTHVHSLSVPLNNWQDARYMIPIFGQAYYEARVLAVRGGGMRDEASSDASSSSLMSLVKIWFNEGGGTSFKDAVEEAKNRLEQGSASSHFEALPTYSPPPPGSSLSAAGPTASHAAPLTTPAGSLDSTVTTSTSAANAESLDSVPGHADLAAATAAREAEEAEEEERERRASFIQPAPGADARAAPAPSQAAAVEPGDLPDYDEAVSSSAQRRA